MSRVSFTDSAETQWARSAFIAYGPVSRQSAVEKRGFMTLVKPHCVCKRTRRRQGQRRNRLVDRTEDILRDVR